MSKFEHQNTKEVQGEVLPTPEVAEKVLNETFQNTQVLGTLLASCKNAKKKKVDITSMLDKFFQR